MASTAETDGRHADIQSVLADIKSIFVDSHTFAIHAAGAKKPIITVDPLLAFENISHRTPFHGMVLADLKRADNRAPGSARIAAQALYVWLSTTLVELNADMSYVSTIAKHRKSVDEILQSVAQKNFWPRWNDIIISAVYGMSATEISTLRTALDMAGPAGKVCVEGIAGHTSIVERVIGNSFNFLPTTAIMSGGKWVRDYAKTIVIDGLIESVSEIDRLLMSCHESKQPTIIFARGFSNDVINTLVVNRARGALDVMAVTVPYDMQFINSLNDVAVVCGCDIVSSLKGDLISSIDIEKFPTVQSVTCIAGSVIIKNDLTRKSVEEHSTRLSQKMSESDIGDINVLFDSRIRSLTSDYVKIMIAAPSEYERRAIIERFDRALRTIRSCKAGGVILWEDIKLGDLSEMFSSMGRSPQTVIPTWLAVVGFQASFRLLEQLISVLHDS